MNFTENYKTIVHTNVSNMYIALPHFAVNLYTYVAPIFSCLLQPNLILEYPNMVYCTPTHSWLSIHCLKVSDIANDDLHYLL